LIRPKVFLAPNIRSGTTLQWPMVLYLLYFTRIYSTLTYGKLPAATRLISKVQNSN